MACVLDVQIAQGEFRLMPNCVHGTGVVLRPTGKVIEERLYFDVFGWAVVWAMTMSCPNQHLPVTEVVTHDQCRY